MGAVVLLSKKGRGGGGTSSVQTELPASVTSFRELARFRAGDEQYAEGIRYRGTGTIVA